MTRFIMIADAPLVVRVVHPLPSSIDARLRAIASQSDATSIFLDFNTDKATVALCVRDRSAGSIEGNIAAAIEDARRAWMLAIAGDGPGARPQGQLG